MANWYVYSGASGTNAGTSWVNAFTTLAAAITASTAGDDIWLASDHNETSASNLNYVFKGSNTAFCRVVSVNRAGSQPPVAADILNGAQITTTGSGATGQVTCNGRRYIRGVTFNVGTGTGNAFYTDNGSAIYEQCNIKLLTTSTGTRLQQSAGGGNIIRWINCSITFSNASQGAQVGQGQWYWTNDNNGTALNGTLPTTFFLDTISNYKAVWSGLDLSNFSSGTLTTAGFIGDFTLINCALPSSWTVTSTQQDPIINGGIKILGCNSSGVVERNEKYDGRATLTTELTVIRTNGATDGTTPYSWKIVTTAYPQTCVPFETFEGVIWNTSTGIARTLTGHCVTDNVALNNNDIWLDVEYLGTSSNTQVTLATSGPANILSTGSALTSDSGATWTTTGLTTPNKQSFAVSFTPQVAGLIRWKVKVAKASTTIYVCPKIELT